MRLPPLPECDAQGVEAADGAQEGARSEGRQVRVLVAALLRERAPLHERHDDAVASPYADMRTALSSRCLGGA